MFASAWFVVLALLGFGFVIAIHELGHFVFAKLAGVKVERFSIGFGPILWSRRIGETEYSLSALPLGGYVKMLGEENPAQGATVDDEGDPRSYNRATRPWKAAILLGGVLFNLVSSWLILLGLAFWGMPMRPPIVADVQPEMSVKGVRTPSPASRLGLKAGDVVLSVNGQRVRSFDEITVRIAADSNQPVTMRVRRDGRELDLPAAGADPVIALSGPRGLPAIGIEPPLAPVVGAVRRIAGDPRPDDPQPGDRILAVAGRTVEGEVVGQRVEEHLRAHVGEVVEVRVAPADGGEAVRRFRYAGPSVDLGVEFPVQIRAVHAGRPADLAGLRPGDIVISVDGEPVRSTSHFIGLIKRHEQGELRIRVLSGGAERELVMRVAEQNGSGRIGAEVMPLYAGVVPFLPPSLDGGQGALAAAGLKPGEGLAVRQAKRDAPLEFIAFGPATEVAVPLEPADDLALVKAGWFGRPAVASRLVALRVAEPPGTDGALAAVDVDGVHVGVSLAALSAPTLERLRETLRPDDWIAGRGVAEGGRPALIVLRGVEGAPRRLKVEPQADAVVVALSPYYEPPYRLESPGEAFAIANAASVNMVRDTLRLIPRFFRSAEEGGIDATQTLAGPIGIFSEFKVRAERVGFASFLKLVALIGLNLFLVNLLPIPIVDGGQLLFLGIEAIIRRPLPEPMRLVANYAGFALVVALMAFTLGIDIWRQLDWL